MDAASQLRGEIARRRVYGYRVAARARINSSRLSQLINGRAAITDELAIRILRAIDDEARESTEDTGGGDGA